MKRRTFLPSAAAAATVTGAAAASQSGSRAVFELKRYQLRNLPENQNQRMNEYLGKVWMPAVKRAGAGPVGCFGSVIAEQTPFAMTLTSYASLAAMEAAEAKLAEDKEYQQGMAAVLSQAGLSYMRVDSNLFRAFATMPSIEVPSTEGRTAPRIFEMRVYESSNPVTLATKVKMFEEGGEIAIFRKTGLQPVFFSTALAGQNMPNLTYLLAFDDLSSREKNWRAFVGSPEWKKLSSMKEYADALIVSNISNAILRPMPFSDIR